MSFKVRTVLALGLSVLFIAVAGSTTLAAGRAESSFDSDWRFVERDQPQFWDATFDDGSWRKLNVPHDWSVESAPSRENPSGAAGGFFVDGIGCYRKIFTLNDAEAGKRIFIHFDSVMANSDVWINGHLLGHRPSGYAPLHYELTKFLNFGEGKTNVLAVRVDELAEPASRYYTGAGIIGHVKLVVVDPLHVQHDTLVVTTPSVDADAATIGVKATIINQSEVPRKLGYKVELFDPDGKSQASDAITTARPISAGACLDIAPSIEIDHPQLWDLAHRAIYRATLSVMDGDQVVDTESTSFGIRSIHFDPATGFSLNGKSVRIQGVCLHADASCFGTAVPISVWERRLSALKPFGVNAIRTAHNPPGPEFLDLCDRMGFLVMDEMFDCWEVAKNKYDYHLFFDEWSLTDLDDAVRRDRNHPSVILYSAGNEIHDTPHTEASLKILGTLVKEFHEIDPTRPVTQALLRPNVSHDYTDGLADLLDVVGTNYRMKELVAAQQAKPSRLIIGTENHLSDVTFMADHPQLAGIFLWAGADYLGEARDWPQIANSSGIFDRTDEPRASAYFAKATWSRTPFVHLARGVSKAVEVKAYVPGIDGDDPNLAAATGPVETTRPSTQPTGRRRRRPVLPEVNTGPVADWTPVNLHPHLETVWTYSNCQRIELTLNGIAVGPAPDNSDLPRGTKVFPVSFAPGILKAIAYDAAGNAVAWDELHTAGSAAKIVLSCDTTRLAHDWDDVACVRAVVTDDKGVTVPMGDQEISFTASGPAKVVCTDSADNKYHEPFSSTQRLSFRGQCFAMIRSNADEGSIRVTASSPGLVSNTLRLEAAPMAR